MLRRGPAGRVVREVIAALETDAGANGGAPIVLVAAPRLLGTYRRLLPAGLKERVAVEIRLDLTKLPVPELNKRVREAVMALPIAVTSRFPAPRRRKKT